MRFLRTTHASSSTPASGMERLPETSSGISRSAAFFALAGRLASDASGCEASGGYGTTSRWRGFGRCETVSEPTSPMDSCRRPCPLGWQRTAVGRRRGRQFPIRMTSMSSWQRRALGRRSSARSTAAGFPRRCCARSASVRSTPTISFDGCSRTVPNPPDWRSRRIGSRCDHLRSRSVATPMPWSVRGFPKARDC